MLWDVLDAPPQPHGRSNGITAAVVVFAFSECHERGMHMTSSVLLFLCQNRRDGRCTYHTCGGRDQLKESSHSKVVNLLIMLPIETKAFDAIERAVPFILSLLQSVSTALLVQICPPLAPRKMGLTQKSASGGLLTEYDLTYGCAPRVVGGVTALTRRAAVSPWL